MSVRVTIRVIRDTTGVIKTKLDMFGIKVK